MLSHDLKSPFSCLWAKLDWVVKVTGIGSAIFAFLAAGTFHSIEEAQQFICPLHTAFTPDAAQQKVYDELFLLYRGVYFGFGQPTGGDFGNVLPKLIRLARTEQNGTTH